VRTGLRAVSRTAGVFRDVYQRRGAYLLRPVRQMRLTFRTCAVFPAGATDHEVKRCYTFERDKLLLSITPHMHYRAHDVTYELVRPNGAL